MKSKFLISALLLSAVIIGGCSAGNTGSEPKTEHISESNHAMDQSNMDHDK